MTLAWATPGEKRITIAATDGVTSASAARAALIFNVTASGLAQGNTNHACTFEANIMPDVVSFPITYTWEAMDKAAIVHANVYQTNDNAAFTWTTPGTKTVTVTAAIAGATTQAAHMIKIAGLVLDKYIFLPLVLRQ